MTARRITAEDEHQWLIDRDEHRAPVDAHFKRAIADALASSRADAKTGVLELGPGPCCDIGDQLRGQMYYVAADTRPARVGITDLEPLWTTERRLPYQAKTFTHILAREVFEHVYHLREMLAECHRVLTPGGTLWFSTPFAFPYHDIEPENGGDFWRATALCWDRMLSDAGFTSVEVTEARFLFGSWQLPVSILGRAVK